MARGGARARSGPAPDPEALRRNRKDDVNGWVRLDPEARVGAAAPVWPVPHDQMLPPEQALWEELWQRPQAVMWQQLGLEHQVAAYVRTYIESMQPEAPASYKSAAIRMQEDLGLSVAGLLRNRWKIQAAQPAEQAEEKPATTARNDVRARLKAVA